MKPGIFHTILFVYIAFICCYAGCRPAPAYEHDKETLVKAKGKSPLILLTDRPVNLETPLHYFKEDFTPNDVFFVRWHNPVLPDTIDPETFRLTIKGHVRQELSLSLEALMADFPVDSVAAVAACAGNARSFCDPRVPGGQWKNGAMGHALWKGVRLKYLLEKAGIKNGAVEVAFDGLDEPALPSVPDYVKSLGTAHALQDEVLIAYAMNGEPLPLLNGYPLKLIVPGWYATYWVGMLNEITVLAEPFDGHWMKKAYLIPKGIPDANEKPGSLSTDMTPINRLNIRSIFVDPVPETVLKPGQAYEIQGIAYDDGAGIAKVELSTDNGMHWFPANLDPVIGPYAWRRWRYTWVPQQEGEFVFLAKATGITGETQPDYHWNRSGYMRNAIESLKLAVRK